jgi:hypothetical protein
VTPHVLLDGLVEREARDGEPLAAGEARDELHCAASPELEPSPDRSQRARAPVAGAELDEPGAVVPRGREPDLDVAPVESGEQGRADGRRHVDDGHVARREIVREDGESRMGDCAVVTRAHEERDVVPSGTPYLGRLARDVAR